MWLDIEAALRQAMTGALPNTPVYGTLDEPPLDETAETCIQVAYLGYHVADQSHNSQGVMFDLLFAVRIVVAAIAIDADQRQRLADGMTEITRRTLAFTLGTGPAPVRPRIVDAPPPQWQGGAGELALYFTLRKVFKE